MLTPERKETRMSLAGGLTTMANKDADFLTTQSLLPRLKSVLKGRFASAEKVNATATRALII
jgi:hypothetical protein